MIYAGMSISKNKYMFNNGNWTGDELQLAEDLPNMHEALGSSAELHTPSMAPHACDPECEAGYSELWKVILGCIPSSRVAWAAQDPL